MAAKYVAYVGNNRISGFLDRKIAGINLVRERARLLSWEGYSIKETSVEYPGKPYEIILGNNNGREDCVLRVIEIEVEG